MRIPKIFILAILLGQAAAFADPYNSYLWNRANANAQNGQIDKGDWYEWWYYKVVLPESKEAFFFTYGVINPWDANATLPGTTAILQAGDFREKILLEQAFPLSEFAASREHTEIHVGNNTATEKQIAGRVEQSGHSIAWDLKVARDWRFNAMDWAMKIPEISGIYWYPAQAAARMSGWIQVDGETKVLQNAPAYQDRNWGRNFPKWWTWLTSNHFKDSPGTSLAAGGGFPKAFDAAYLFAGLCIGLNYQSHEYAFRTTNADLVSFQIGWGTWEVAAENKYNQRIEISAFAPKEAFMRLPFHTPRGQEFSDYEALLGKMKVKLYERAGIFADWKLKASLETEEAGIEWGTPKVIGMESDFSLQALFQGLTKFQ